MIGCKIHVYAVPQENEGCVEDFSEIHSIRCAFLLFMDHSLSLCPFGSRRLSYLTPGVESVTQAWPFSAPKSLNHSDCFRDGKE